MTRLLPLQGLIKNMKGEIPKRQRAYLPQDRAYQLLKDWTGRDFGLDVEAWENWVKEHPHIIPSKHLNSITDEID
jgi:hypothetical protein